MAHEQLGGDEVRREELTFAGEYDGFDPELRAHLLGKIAGHAVQLWAEDGTAAFDARLVAAELLANTHRHGLGPSALTIANIREGGSGYFEVSVANAVSDAPEEPAGAHIREIEDDSSESGRGIRIINELSRGNWEQVVEQLPDGRHVVRITARLPVVSSNEDPNGSGHEPDAPMNEAA